MARRSSLSKIRIICNRGDVYIEGRSVDVFFKYKFWLFQINPRLLLPGFRKSNVKNVYVNGRKLGHAETYFKCPPLPQYRTYKGGLSGKILDFFRLRLGLFCETGSEGYMQITLKRQRFIITRSYTSAGNLMCSAYFYKSGNRLATFTFDKDFTMVALRFGNVSWAEAILTMAGYVADSMIYASVAGSLNREIEVKYL